MNNRKVNGDYELKCRGKRLKLEAYRFICAIGTMSQTLLENHKLFTELWEASNLPSLLAICEWSSRSMTPERDTPPSPRTTGITNIISRRCLRIG